MILPELNESKLYDTWRGGALRPERKPAGSPVFTGTEGYLETLVCPSNPQPNRFGTPVGYAVNTGIPDFRRGRDGLPVTDSPRTGCRCAACGGKPVEEEAVEYAAARDLAANGVFFDRFTSSRHFDPAKRTRPVVARLEQMVDPKEKTILLVDNVDAETYGFDSFDPARDGTDELYSIAESGLGATWSPDSRFTTDGAVSSGVMPTMTPPVASMRINVDGNLGNGISYDYARPASWHPGGVNMAFVDGSARFVKDSLSYYVYARLMASDDANAGGVDAGGNVRPLAAEFRSYTLTDADLNP
jgi:prepilin-type processing-associated H-X9-DG protein